ncbi:MAG: murein L,D-transpeptidase [Pseudorhodobacter sp.]
MTVFSRFSGARLAGVAIVALTAIAAPVNFVGAQTLGQNERAERAFAQSLAIAASEDPAIAGFFRDRNYRPFWTSPDQAARRASLLTALDGAEAHGLPVVRYRVGDLISSFGAARTEGDRGRLEVAMTRAFLSYAQDLQSGALEPGKVVSAIKREVPRRDPREMLDSFAMADAETYLEGLVPRSQSYVQLMKAKLELEKVIAHDGWGATVSAGSLKPGATGAAVIALRDRLQAMGYLGRSATASYDGSLQKAVQRFQTDHGLDQDGIAAAATISEINIGPQERLRSVLVALERERWMNIDRGARHIWVNLTDFTAKIIDNGKVTLATRAVVGAPNKGKPTPEFSHAMTYMEVNPDWTVPGGIIKRDYLPRLKANPNALGHLQVIDRRGRVVPRSAINFANYSARNFPFNLRQPPGRSNALGRVKFMFPNPYAIYLHDTPDKHLFQRDVRAFSAGCVRLNNPFEFAYELLSRQDANPKKLFHDVLDSGRQERIFLETPVPVHLNYFTAFVGPKGRMNYRRDVYGRDAAIYDALRKAGVSPEADRS